MTERYTTLYPEIEVQAQIGRIATEILQWTELDDVPDPLFVSLLEGGRPFGDALMHALTDLEKPGFYPTHRSMTIARDVNSDIPSIQQPLSRNVTVNGRRVVLLDVMNDRGETVRVARENLIEMGAKSVHLAVLLQKNTELRPIEKQAEYVGFHVPEGWYAGWGLRDVAIGEEAFRYHRNIMVIGQEDLPPRAALINV